MKYLFTYANGKKALGTTNYNRGLAIKVGDQKVYPLLVSPNAFNASCIRYRYRNTNMAIAYVPSLVIPGVLCSKIGSSYVDPAGISYTDKFYRRCYYDTYHGQYIAYSSYRNKGVENKGVAVSVDGHNWVATTIPSDNWVEKHAVVNTKYGVYIAIPTFVDAAKEGYWRIRVNIYNLYWHAGTESIRISLVNYLILEQEIDKECTYYKVLRSIEASNNDDSIIIGFETEYRIYEQTYFYQKIWHYNVQTDVSTVIHTNGSYDQSKYEENKLKDVNYNHILQKFLYANGLYWFLSSDGINYIEGSLDIPYKKSLGNLNGKEVFAEGLSNDGIYISQGYSNRPHAYDPLENKYIRVTQGWTGTGHGSEVIPYFDIYESLDLYNWSFVLRKTTNTIINSQVEIDVNTDGFACVKGF